MLLRSHGAEVVQCYLVLCWGGELVGSPKLPPNESLSIPGLRCCASLASACGAKPSLGISPRDKSPFTSTRSPEQLRRTRTMRWSGKSRTPNSKPVLPLRSEGGRASLRAVVPRVGWVGKKKFTVVSLQGAFRDRYALRLPLES